VNRLGSAIAEAIVCWLPFTVAQVLSQVRSYGICGGQNTTGGIFSLSTLVPLPIVIRMSFIIICHVGLTQQGQMAKVDSPYKKKKEQSSCIVLPHRFVCLTCFQSNNLELQAAEKPGFRVCSLEKSIDEINEKLSRNM
jgi:hypothetical protein